MKILSCYIIILGLPPSLLDTATVNLTWATGHLVFNVCHSSFHTFSVHFCHCSPVPWQEVQKKRRQGKFSMHMTITWPSHDQHMTITWPSHGHPWPSHDQHMNITWPSHDYHMTITWPSHDHHMAVYDSETCMWCSHLEKQWWLKRMWRSSLCCHVCSVEYMNYLTLMVREVTHHFQYLVDFNFTLVTV